MNCELYFKKQVYLIFYMRVYIIILKCQLKFDLGRMNCMYICFKILKKLIFSLKTFVITEEFINSG